MQTIDSFADWPQRAFGEPKPYSAEWTKAVVESMHSAKQFAEKQAGFVEGMSLWLIGGWGSGYNVRLERDPELEDWYLVPVEPADAALLGISDDGSVHDVWRLQKQLSLVEAQGFEFFGVNGLLNRFQWWRNTDYALVPPHMIDMRPPLNINFDTNLLLQVRQSGQEAIDRRTAQHPDGTHQIIARLNHQVLVGKFEPIYASIDAVLHRRLLGVVIIANSAWWVELMDDGRQPYSSTAFRIWEAVLHWVAVVMPPFLGTPKLKDTLSTIAFDLEIRWDDVERARVLTDEDIAHCIEVAVDPERKRVKITLRSDWHWALRRTDNTAEILLATHLLVGAARLFGVDRSDTELATLVGEAAKSPDLRWIHSFEARTALEGLEAGDLIKGFYPIPKSPAGLAKCGAVWSTRPRDFGNWLIGKKSCAEFLTDHSKNLLTRLRTEVRRFDRKALVVMALEDLQAALNEQRRWQLTARALRAVHGVEGDFEASLLRAGQANAVIRAATILAEVATAEAPEQGGMRVGRMDMEELEARAVMVFAAGDALAAVYGDRIEPTFNISPTGDLLYDHRFEELTIQRAAEVRHESDRRYAAQQYGEHFEARPLSPSMEAKLQTAISAEYGVDYDAFVGVPSAALQLAIQMSTGVITTIRADRVAGRHRSDSW